MCGEQVVPIVMLLHGSVAPQLSHGAGTCLQALPQCCMWPDHLAGRLLLRLSLPHKRAFRQMLVTPLMIARMTTCRRRTQTGMHTQCMPLTRPLIE